MDFWEWLLVLIGGMMAAGGFVFLVIVAATGSNRRAELQQVRAELAAVSAMFEVQRAEDDRQFARVSDLLSGVARYAPIESIEPELKGKKDEAATDSRNEHDGDAPAIGGDDEAERVPRDRHG